MKCPCRLKKLGLILLGLFVLFGGGWAVIKNFATKAVDVTSDTLGTVTEGAVEVLEGTTEGAEGILDAVLDSDGSTGFDLGTSVGELTESILGGKEEKETVVVPAELPATGS